MTLNGGTIQDAAGNNATITKAAVSSNSGYIVDNTAPAAPTSVALAADTGSSTTDGITNNRNVNVTLAEAGGTWQYSTDSGTTWTAGSGTSFMLADNQTYAANAIKVKQTDAAGNVGTAGGIATAVTVDNTAPVITGNATTFSVAENTTAVTTLTATDTVSTSGLVWSLESGGTDNTLFSIDSGTGALSFKTAPNYEDATRPSHAYSVKVGVTDAVGNIQTRDITVNVTDVNEAPVNTLATSTFAATTATALAISGVSVNDVDAGNNGIASVTLTVLHGTVSVTSGVSGGLAAAGISNNGSASVTLTGTQSAINATLATLSYTSTSGYTGTDTLTVLTTDGGTTALTDSDTVAITVSAAADTTAPTVFSIELAGKSESTNSQLNAGDTVDVAVTFSEAVVITGTPRVALTVGSSTVYATYDSSNASKASTKKFFRYTIARRWQQRHHHQGCGVLQQRLHRG